MAYSKTQIVTAALNTLRSEGILSLTEDSIEARYANNKIEMLIDFFLATTDWQCASRTVTLVQREDTSPFADLEYVYDIPPDMIRPISVIKEGNPYNISDQYYGRVHNSNDQSYIIEGSLLYYAYDSCVIKYLKTIETGNMRKYMIYPLTLFVAAELAYGIANSANYGDLLMKRFEKSLSEARESNNLEMSNYYRIGRTTTGRTR